MPQCKAITKAGTQCSRPVTAGSADFCYQHVKGKSSKQQRPLSKPAKKPGRAKGKDASAQLSRTLEFDLVISKVEEDGGMGDTQSVSSLSPRVRKLVEERVRRDQTNIRDTVSYPLEKEFGIQIIGFKYLAPDTVRLTLDKPVTKKQRQYLGCAWVDPSNAGVDLWMEGDIEIIKPGEDPTYPYGAELLVMLKDEHGEIYECGSEDYFDLTPD
jgi:hypothetical protein